MITHRFSASLFHISLQSPPVTNEQNFLEISIVASKVEVDPEKLMIFARISFGKEESGIPDGISTH